MSPQDTYAKILSKEIKAQISKDSVLTTNSLTLNELQSQRLYNCFLEHNLNDSFFEHSRGQTIIVPINHMQAPLFDWLLERVDNASLYDVKLRFSRCRTIAIHPKILQLENHNFETLKRRELLV